MSLISEVRRVATENRTERVILVGVWKTRMPIGMWDSGGLVAEVLVGIKDYLSIWN